MIDNIVEKTVNDGTSGHRSRDKKYMVRIPPDRRPQNLKLYDYLEPDNELIRNFLLQKQFIFRDGVSYECPRTLHPSKIYFMFFYRINKQTLQLVSFSHPFIILKNNQNNAYLNFPMGITTNHIQRRNAAGQLQYIPQGPHVWLSYGDSDCRCLVAAFKNEQLETLVTQNTNDTPLANIEWWIYQNNDIQ
jgi:hypothetical protein